MIKKILIFLSFLSLSYSAPYQIQDSFNKFGISLFKKISLKDNSSLMISPISVSYSLLMVNYGASGRTSEEILSVLNLLPPRTMTDFPNLNRHIKEFVDLYSSNSVFQINNSIWIQNDKCYKPNLQYVNYIDSVFISNPTLFILLFIRIL